MPTTHSAPAFGLLLDPWTPQNGNPFVPMLSPPCPREAGKALEVSQAGGRGQPSHSLNQDDSG